MTFRIRVRLAKILLALAALVAPAEVNAEAERLRRLRGLSD